MINVHYHKTVLCCVNVVPDNIKFDPIIQCFLKILNDRLFINNSSSLFVIYFVTYLKFFFEKGYKTTGMQRYQVLSHFKTNIIWGKNVFIVNHRHYKEFSFPIRNIILCRKRQFLFSAHFLLLRSRYLQMVLNVPFTVEHGFQLKK